MNVLVYLSCSLYSYFRYKIVCVLVHLYMMSLERWYMCVRACTCMHDECGRRCLCMYVCTCMYDICGGGGVCMCVQVHRPTYREPRRGWHISNSICLCHNYLWQCLSLTSRLGWQSVSLQSSFLHSARHCKLCPARVPSERTPPACSAHALTHCIISMVRVIWLYVNTGKHHLLFEIASSIFYSVLFHSVTLDAEE